MVTTGYNGLTGLGENILELLLEVIGLLELVLLGKIIGIGIFVVLLLSRELGNNTGLEFILRWNCELKCSDRPLLGYCEGNTIDS